MELSLTPMTFIVGLFLTISLSILFVRRIIKHIRKFNIEESPIHVIRKRRVLLFYMTLTLAGLMTFFSLGLTVEHPVLYRSIFISGKSLILAYIDTFNAVIIKSMVCLAISMIISLLYKFPDTRSKSIMFYSIIRLLVYNYILVYFYEYKYFRFFLSDLVELSESFLLLLIFISLLNKIGRHKPSNNLFEQYESVFIYKRSKSSCFLFIIGIIFEIFYYSLLIFLSVGNLKINYVMDFIMIFKMIYIAITLSAVTNIIYSKEQPIHDTLVSMYKMRLEMEDETQEERKRVKKNDFYKLTL